jgi:hypothetical protein
MRPLAKRWPSQALWWDVAQTFLANLFSSISLPAPDYLPSRRVLKVVDAMKANLADLMRLDIKLLQVRRL